MTDKPHHVVVIGGGFGGLQAARSLRKAPVRVTLVDRRNIFVQNPESARYAATVAMLATVLDEAQESFRYATSFAFIFIVQVLQSSFLSYS